MAPSHTRGVNFKTAEGFSAGDTNSDNEYGYET